MIDIDGRTEDVCGFAVQSFETSHDSVACRGYRITTPLGRVAGVATDLGYVSDEVLANLLLADVVALVCVMATVAAVHPLYLLFLVPVFFVFAVEVYKSKCVYRRDMSMTANKRMQAYVQRTVYLREYAKDMRTSNIFAVMVRRMEAATKANVRILRDYGVRLFL